MSLAISLDGHKASDAVMAVRSLSKLLLVTMHK
jgi:hypothetical protein